MKGNDIILGGDKFVAVEHNKQFSHKLYITHVSSGAVLNYTDASDQRIHKFLRRECGMDYWTALKVYYYLIFNSHKLTTSTFRERNFDDYGDAEYDIFVKGCFIILVVLILDIVVGVPIFDSMKSILNFIISFVS